MQAGKPAVGTCIRRRTLTTKIIPAILQAVVVVALWEAGKLFLPSSKTSEVNASIKNARSLVETKCPATEISHAAISTLLNLSSVMNVAKMISHKRTQAYEYTYHSKVDVYARDKKGNNLIFYPAGSLIDFGGIKGNIEETIVASNKSAKKEYAVKLDDSDDVPYDVKDTLVNKDGSLSVKEGSVNQIPLGSAPRNAYYKWQGKVDDHVERFKPEVQRSQQGSHYGEPQIDAGFRINENQQKRIVRDTSNVKMPQTSKHDGAAKKAESKGQSDPFENLRKLHENLVKNMASVDASESKDLGGYDKQQFGNEMPNYGNQFGGGSANNIHNADAQFLSRGILIDERGERLYAEGFLDRVRKLSTELFGKLMKNITANEEPIKLVMNSPSLCTVIKDIDILFLINSEPQNSDLRHRIRETFVNPSFFQNVKIVHVFLVGKTTSPVLQQSLYQEQSAHQDLIQGDFLDARENDTLKGLMGMRWVTQYCSLAKYIMKINDAVFVDTDKLVHGLIPAAKKIAGKRMMLCDFQPESDLIRSGPGGISEELFPGRSRLRPYCKGYAVLMTRGVISSLLAASDYVPSIYLDELYLYGILPFVSGNVDVFDVGGKRAFHNFGVDTVNCYSALLDNCPFVASVAFSEGFTILWDMVRTRMEKLHQGWENERSLWEVEHYRRRF